MSTPAGWYDDGRGQMRYWDGAAWTEHVAPPVAPAAPPTPPTATAPPVPQPDAVGAAPAVPPTGAYPPAAVPAQPATRSRKGLWIGLIIGGAAFLVIVIVVVVVLIFSILRGATSGPQQAITAYNQAWMEGDCTTLEDVTTSDWKQEWSYTCSDVEANAATPPLSWHVTVSSTHVSDDEADVDYTLSGVDADGVAFSADYTAELVYENGTWLVDEDTYLG